MNGQVIMTFNGTSAAFTMVSLSTVDGIAPIGSITLQNNGSIGYAVIDDFSLCAVQAQQQLTEKLFFAQFADGAVDTVQLCSQVTLVNLSSTQAVTGKIEILDDSGKAIIVDGIGTQDTFRIAPGGSALPADRSPPP